ncbi:hypothetical protein SFOMI_0866 [Sphingobium fuliginis]|uniref:Uncharacterized protein n=1 Tax=Sphingobium fuliginis (strain ATCC 27551) TaxID=336203 RepID=A0A292Z169_SPHSA|nr:hypothetical protein SFOMI_0866 [Sphingobium fuliginis]
MHLPSSSGSGATGPFQSPHFSVRCPSGRNVTAPDELYSAGRVPSEE